MKFYKASELVIGQTYKCRLSGYTMLIKLIADKWVDTMEGRHVTHSHVAAIYHNPMTGGFNELVPSDDQFTDIP